MNDVKNNEEQKSKTFQRRRGRLFLISQLQLPAGPSRSPPIPSTLLGAVPFVSFFNLGDHYFTFTYETKNSHQRTE